MHASHNNAEGTQVTMRVRFVKELSANSPPMLSTLNLIFKHCLRRCGFVEFGKKREYFDFNDLKHCGSLPNVKIALGYATTIGLYDQSLLLRMDVSHKLINRERVDEYMERIIRSARHPEEAKPKIERQLVGQTVMTMYNKKTYKIDDIAWDKKPTDTFETRPKRGETQPGQASFIEYYQRHHNQKIKNPNQPLLVSRVSQRRINPETRLPERFEQIVLLLPELCALTGNALMVNKNDFRAKQDLAATTNQGPSSRFEKLNGFLRQVRSEETSRDELANWQIQFDPAGLVKLQGLRLPTENIYFGGDV